MRISDWSSDVCSSDLLEYDSTTLHAEYLRDREKGEAIAQPRHYYPGDDPARLPVNTWRGNAHLLYANWINDLYQTTPFDADAIGRERSEEHTSELQSLMRISYAVFCLKKKKETKH